MATLDLTKNLNPLSLNTTMGSFTAASTPAVFSTPPAPTTVTGSTLPATVPPVPVPSPAPKEPTVLGSSVISDKIAVNKDTIKKAADTGLRTDAAGNITYADGTLYKANESVYSNPEYTSSPQQDIEKVASGASTAGDFGKDARGNVVNMRTGQIVQAAPGTFTGDGKPGGGTKEGQVLGSTNPKDPNYVLNPNSPAYNPAYFDENPELDPRYKKNFEDIDALKASGDIFFTMELENIKKQYEMLINQQKDANIRSEASRAQSLLMGGTSRYAPLNEVGLMHEEVSFGVQKVADLVAEEANAIIAAQKAQQEQNFKLADKKLDLYKEARESRDKEMTKIYDTIQKTKENQIKAAAEQKKELDTQRSDILKDVGKNYAPPEVITAIANAKSVSDMVKAAGEWLQTGTGTVAEYTAYKRDAQGRGLVPVSFDEYQARDANRKIRIQQAANAAGLTTALTNTALKLSDDYEARSKEFYTIRDNYNRILSVAHDPSAAGDLALIFSYMKVLDPTSTVREGEFANASNAGSAWNKVGSQYNKIVNGQRLTTVQRADFLQQAKNIFDASKKTQDKTAADFVERAGQYGVPANLVVRGTDANPGMSSAGEISMDRAGQAKNTVDTYVDTHPDMADKIAKFYEIPGMDDAKIAKWIANQQK